MTTPAPTTPRLMRSRDDAWLGGVCGGIAKRFGWDAAIVRALFVVSILLPGPQVLLYIALWIVIPREPATPPSLPEANPPAPYPPAAV
ncbi:PspC domain-containing protein [Gordonia rhizosphera]|uniref:Phage shock protein PspC N-terminal domain-containing protein n=1 Tax=Gordonia rhizosphera NBRC 16068 TaxID=1108045 RepID=K6WIQ1_9ACTN|nr:PspC domain-containing protein [Gordonia rhizosphera]GAB93666.1 hypothetical protein GORHZ_235_00150 [Gordonia rhizosphera NBRC 16068]